MTILDIVSRDAFQESSLESGPGRPGGRWEPALNQSTKTNATKRGWSLGGVARGAAIGSLVVGGAAAAVLASNAQRRKELMRQLRAAILRFLDIDSTYSQVSLANDIGALQSGIATIRGTISTLSEGADSRRAADEERRASESDTQRNVDDRIAKLESAVSELHADTRVQDIAGLVRELHKDTNESEKFTEELVAFVGEALKEVRAAQIEFERIRQEITNAVDASVNTSDLKLDEIQTRVGELAERNATMKGEVLNAVFAATDASDESATAKLALALEEIRRLHAEILAISQGASLTSKSNPNVGTHRATAARLKLRGTTSRSSTAGRDSKFGGRRYV